ncbi:RodZ domain-containing protein [Nocardioides terrisoli]|uniref:RodZ domain-containing protein n=1 Tax=Nocardioides terrisoli TaxID=3388267 RepID=UPI00287BA73B|nr:RodZ domain-containing protein [Nocardioides marmorisolisilvae]
MTPGETDTTQAPFEVRRNTLLSAVLGIGAAAMAIAYLQRAGSGGSTLDWLICLVMAAIAVVQLVALVDARTPLLVADDQGVRIRLGGEWLGLPWGTVEQVVVEERDTPVRDGRLVVVPRNLGNALEALLPSSRRAAAWQRRLHGAPLTVPLSIGTRSSGDSAAAELRALAGGRADVVSLRGRERAHLDEQRIEGPDRSALTDTDQRAAELSEQSDPVLLAGPEIEPAPAQVTAPAPPRIADPVAAVRAARKVMRADVVRDDRPRIATPVRVEPADVTSRGAVVFDDFAPAARPDPLIGPVLAQARDRAGLTVDELSERTRIRPHVLEAMEVDDFAPCGGDFYARGHLRTLARYLGLDVDPLMATYDEHYSHGPINARRVFEAELATGMGGGMRATVGGPRWSLLVGAVLCLVMIWGVARFFTEQPPEITAPNAGDSAGLASNQTPITSPLTTIRQVEVKAIGARSRVVIVDRHGKALWRGVLHRGQSHGVAGVGPFQVHASNGAATRIRLGHTWRGQVGMLPQPAVREIG